MTTAAIYTIEASRRRGLLRTFRFTVLAATLAEAIELGGPWPPDCTFRRMGTVTYRKALAK